MIVAKNSGFCSGVKKAVDRAMTIPAENTYVYGELIHNREVVDQITARGLIMVDSVSDVPDGATLLIRSHGAARAVYEECARRNIRIEDCTCAFVKKSRGLVECASKAGKTVVITGSADHPEVRGLVGWASGEVYVYASPEDDFSILSGKEVALISQTTFSEKTFLKIAENVQKVRPKTVEIFPTICYTTLRRQQEAEKLARIADAVLVIGGQNSSNTGKLKEIASQHCKRVIRLCGADDFEYEKIKGCKKVAVIAGASTPDWQTREVLCKMEENNTEVQEMTMQSVVDGINKTERYRKGQFISAKIVSATEEGVYVSASGKLEILLPKDELDCADYSREAYAGRVGEELKLMVVEVNPVKLSEKAAKKIKEEEALLTDIEAGKDFTVTCTGFNKGGLTAQLGTYLVFIPAKEIRNGYVNDLEKYVGEKLRLRKIEIKRERRKEIIASRRVILVEEKAAKDAKKAEKEEAFFNSIEVGSIVEGKVERIAKFGAFVSVNDFDCLAHISDLSWSNVKSVTDVLEVGKRYQFQVLKIDRENKKVSIGYKQLQPQPWDLAAQKYAVGDVIHGKVIKILPYGAFVELEKGIDGLVHVSEISHQWLENPTSALKPGEEVDAQIKEFNPVDRKISLSIKALLPPPEVEAHYAKEKDHEEGKGAGRKPRKNGGKKNFAEEEDEYREWNEGGFGGVSIGEILHGDDKEDK